MVLDFDFIAPSLSFYPTPRQRKNGVKGVYKNVSVVSPHA